MLPSVDAARQGRGSGFRWWIAGAAALVLSACADLPGTQGDPSAPILIRGIVVHADGSPVGGASLQLEVRDPGNHQFGEPAPLVYRGTFTAGLDGTFAIHLLATPGIVNIAMANSGLVSFLAAVAAPDGRPVNAFEFMREVGEASWVGAAAAVEISPTGVQQVIQGAN